MKALRVLQPAMVLTTTALTALALLGLRPTQSLATSPPVERPTVVEKKADQEMVERLRKLKKRLDELKAAEETAEEKTPGKDAPNDRDAEIEDAVKRVLRSMEVVEKPGEGRKSEGVRVRYQLPTTGGDASPAASPAAPSEPDRRWAATKLVQKLLDSNKPEVDMKTGPVVENSLTIEGYLEAPSASTAPATGAAASPGDDGKSAEWFKDAAAGRRRALARRTPILIRVGAEWCEKCKLVEKEIVKPDIQPALAEFTKIYVDATRPSEEATKMGVTAVPTWRIETPLGVRIAEKQGFLSADELVKWLAENQEAAAAQPADALLTSGEPSETDLATLVGQFADRTPLVREAAVRRLLPYPKTGGPAVVEAFRKGDLSTRLASLELLEQWKAPIEGVDPWNPKTLTKDRLTALSNWASRAPEAPPIRPETLTPEQRAELGRQVARMLAVDESEASAVRERLAGWGPALLPEVYDRLKNAASDEARARLTALRYRLVMSDALALRWPGGVARLAVGDPRERQQAAEQLAQLAGVDDQALLLELFADSDPLVREISLRGLQNIGGPKAAAALVRLLADPEPNVRAAVLKQLEEKPQKEMVAAVAEYLKTEKDPDLLGHAIRFLKAAGGDDAVRAMLGLLTHESWQVRAEAAVGVAAHLGSNRHVSYITINGRTTRQGPNQTPLQKDIQTAMVKLLGDPDAFVVSRAIEGLSNVPAPEAVEPLVAAATKHPTLAVSIVETLTQNDTLREKALPHLMKFAQSKTPEIRAAAIDGLFRAAPEQMEKVVLSALNDKDSSVRVTGANVLVRLIEQQKKLKAEAGAVSAYPHPSPSGEYATPTPSPPEATPATSWFDSAMKAMGLKTTAPRPNRRIVWGTTSDGKLVPTEVLDDSATPSLTPATPGDSSPAPVQPYMPPAAKPVPVTGSHRPTAVSPATTAPSWNPYRTPAMPEDSSPATTAPSWGPYSPAPATPAVGPVHPSGESIRPQPAVAPPPSANGSEAETNPAWERLDPFKSSSSSSSSAFAPPGVTVVPRSGSLTVGPYSPGAQPSYVPSPPPSTTAPTTGWVTLPANPSGSPPTSPAIPAEPLLSSGPAVPPAIVGPTPPSAIPARSATSTYSTVPSASYIITSSTVAPTTAVGPARPAWFDKAIGPLEKMLKADKPEERMAAALALTALGKSKEALPVILNESDAKSGVPAETAATLLKSLDWPERGDAFRRLWKRPDDEGRQGLLLAMAELGKDSSGKADSRDAELLWEVLADEKLSLTLAAITQHGLMKSYFASRYYSLSEVDRDKKKAAADAAKKHLDKGGRWQRLVALSIVLIGDPEAAAKEAKAILDDPKQDDAARDHAFRVLLASQDTIDRVPTAVAALKSDSLSRRKAALEYLAAGTGNDYSSQRLSVHYENSDDFLGLHNLESGQPIVPEPPAGLKPEDVRPLLKDADRRTAAMAGYLLAVMNDPAGLPPLLRYWRERQTNEEPGRDEGDLFDAMAYRAIARLNDAKQMPVLEAIRGRQQGSFDLGRFYWTIRIMSGPEILKFRKAIRDEAKANGDPL